AVAAVLGVVAGVAARSPAIREIAPAGELAFAVAAARLRVCGAAAGEPALPAVHWILAQVHAGTGAILGAFGALAAASSFAAVLVGETLDLACAAGAAGRRVARRHTGALALRGSGRVRRLGVRRCVAARVLGRGQRRLRVDVGV